MKMFARFRTASTESTFDGLARIFLRLGWIGFWAQLVLGAVPVALMVYALVFGRSGGPGTRGGLPLIEYVTAAGVLVLAFTTFWSFRYTRLAGRLADPARRPTRAEVQRTAWIGIAGGVLGIAFSMLVMLLEVASLLFYFLRAPQAGVPVIQTTGAGSASWVSAVDVMSLMALVFTVFGELVVLVFSLWLLFRTTTASEAFVRAEGAK